MPTESADFPGDFPFDRTKLWITRRVPCKNLPDNMVEIDGVQGYLLKGDPQFLMQRAAKLPKDGVAVEIGSFMGLSAIIMANAIIGAGNFGARIHCVDTWLGSDVQQHLDVIRDGTLYERFLRNIEAAGVAALIHPIRKRSTDAAGDFSAASIDLLFVDGDYSFAECHADLVAWYPKLKPAAMLFGHDCLAGSGVEQAVQKFAAEHGRTFIVHDLPTGHIFEFT